VSDSCSLASSAPDFGDVSVSRRRSTRGSEVGVEHSWREGCGSLSGNTLEGGCVDPRNFQVPRSIALGSTNHSTVESLDALWTTNRRTYAPTAG
jgi:hypothetical protein